MGILIDQRVREDQGVEVPFFGHPAWTHRVLARLARKTGAPVVPTFALRDKPGHYRLRYDEPVVVDDLPDGELEDRAADYPLHDDPRGRHPREPRPVAVVSRPVEAAAVRARRH